MGDDRRNRVGTLLLAPLSSSPTRPSVEMSLLWMASLSCPSPTPDILLPLTSGARASFGALLSITGDAPTWDTFQAVTAYREVANGIGGERPGTPLTMCKEAPRYPAQRPGPGLGTCCHRRIIARLHTW